MLKTSGFHLVFYKIVSSVTNRAVLTLQITQACCGTTWKVDHERWTYKDLVEGGRQLFLSSVLEFTRQVEEHSEERVRTVDSLKEIWNAYQLDTRNWSFLFPK
jgi:hypothetical protein